MGDSQRNENSLNKTTEEPWSPLRGQAGTSKPPHCGGESSWRSAHVSSHCHLKMTGLAQTRVPLIFRAGVRPPACLWNLLSPRPPCHCLPLGLVSELNPSATHLSSGLNEKAKPGSNEPFVFIHPVTTSPEWFHYFLFQGQAWPHCLKGRSVNKVKPWSNISLWRPGVGLARRPAPSGSPCSPECWMSTMEWEDYLIVEVTGFRGWLRRSGVPLSCHGKSGS